MRMATLISITLWAVIPTAMSASSQPIGQPSAGRPIGAPSQVQETHRQGESDRLLESLPPRPVRPMVDVEIPGFPPPAEVPQREPMPMILNEPNGRNVSSQK